ncbi:MAG: hypothetical protein A3F35_01710 [Candidatus Woykebacteria bacterium RIFCSPHIGHO2_12_FULL_45_10]|uniref:Uncharacterized protein n=1 Tax=Candidatus Woykebacteria bacterium RIFCSPHIGHO2_12_FULL_45_10 TaxID=1802603 RepID=A0A1G1WS62_9BACT|nr:MAG: hypothetical protein A3F35_01710 [Candidatus Woykebacteria bacterium RIFCSPHIGHO2_12_FULL_45_10]
MKRFYILGLLVLIILIALAWSPWVTDEFAVSRINSAIKPCEIGGRSEGVVDVGSLTAKKPFGRELIAIPTSCPNGFDRGGVDDFFVSAFGTVHKIGKKPSSNNTQQQQHPAVQPAQKSY